MNIDIHEIKAPGLNESDYGANIDKQFKNIDNNFRIIGNYDFIKGQPGDGVKIENVKIVAGDNTSSKEIGSLLYKALKTAVESFAKKSSDASDPLNKIGDFKWDDSITKNDFYVPIIIHENKVNNTKEYICSAGVVSFFDNRFSAAALKQPNLYNNDIVDVTSLLNFKKVNDEWNCELNLSFPRLKFKDESFYWVINNEETTIKATGLKGDRGSNGTMVIGKTEYIDKTNSKTEVPVQLLVNDEWVDKAPDYLKAGDIITVLCSIKDNNSYTYNGFFISNITKIDSGIAYAMYRPEANITQINYSKDTVSFFEALGSQEPVDNAQPARGMFLLFDNFKTTPNGSYAKDDSIDDKYAHMIYNDKHKLYISPVNDYKSKNDFSPVVGTNENDTPELNINYKTNISKELAVTSGGATITGKTKIQTKEGDDANYLTVNNYGVGINTTPNSSGALWVNGKTKIQAATEDNNVNYLTVNKYGIGINTTPAVMTKDIFTVTGNSKIKASADIDAKYLTVNKHGIGINTTPGTGSHALNVIGTTKIQASADSDAKHLTVNSSGVGINVGPNSNYALNVSGATNINGGLTAASAEISGALSAGSATITGDITTSGGHVNVNKNIYFTDRGTDTGRYTHHIEAKGKDDSTGTKDTSLTIWASTIQLSGNKDNDQNIIYLGNGGSVEKNKINIQGITNISRKLTVTSGGAAISGETNISGGLTVTSGGLTVDNDGATITGATKIQATNTGEKYLTVNSQGVGINDTPNSNYAFNVSGNTHISGNTTITGITKIQSSNTSAKNYLKVSSTGVGINTDKPTSGYALSVSGKTNISSELKVTSGGLKVDSGGAEISGATTIQSAANYLIVNSIGVAISGDLNVTGGNAFSASSVLHLDTLKDDEWDYVNNVTIDDVTGRLTWPKKQAYMLRLKVSDSDSNNYIVGIPADVYPPNCIVLIDFYNKSYYLHGAGNLDGFGGHTRMFVFGDGMFKQTVGSNTYTFRKPIGWFECGFKWVNN